MFIFGVSCHEMSKTAGSNLPLNSLIKSSEYLKKKKTIIVKSSSVRINQRANWNKIKMETLTPSTKNKWCVCFNTWMWLFPFLREYLSFKAYCRFTLQLQRCVFHTLTYPVLCSPSAHHSCTICVQKEIQCLRL